MMDNKLKITYILSFIIALLALVASLGGLLINDLYNDNVFVLTGWIANDLITLILALPLLVMAIILSMRGSQRALLVLFGVLNYMFYNYSFYLFGAALNLFFPLYVALFILPIFALVFGLSNINIKGVSSIFRAKIPIKLISGYMMFVGILLGVAWIGQWLNFVISGQLPEILINVDSTNFLVAALDLSFVVPTFILAAIWLWKHKSWGYVLAVMLNVKGFIYNVVLTYGSIQQVNVGIKGAGALIPLWIVLGIGALASILLLLRDIKFLQLTSGSIKKPM